MYLPRSLTSDGLHIDIEGPPGCGKADLADRLSQSFNQSNVYKFGVRGDTQEFDVCTRALRSLASRTEYVESISIDLEAGNHLVTVNYESDRVYGKLHEETYDWLESTVNHCLPSPDVVLLLTKTEPVNPDDRLTDVQFEQLQEHYRNIYAHEAHRVVRIDADRSDKAMFEYVKGILQGMICIYNSRIRDS